MQIQQHVEKFICYCLKVEQISFPKGYSQYSLLSKEAWFKSYEHFPKPFIFPKHTTRTGADLARTKWNQRGYVITELLEKCVYIYFKLLL